VRWCAKAVLKDNDWVDAGRRLDFGAEKTRDLISVVRADAAFLATQHVSGRRSSPASAASATTTAPVTAVSQRACSHVRAGQVMDYSLLVGMLPRANSELSVYGLHTAKHEWRLADGGRCTLGIIDVLVRYSLWKRLEHLLLGTLRGGKNISCQPPNTYASRLGNFVARAVAVSPSTSADAQARV